MSFGMNVATVEKPLLMGVSKSTAASGADMDVLRGYGRG